MPRCCAYSCVNIGIHRFPTDTKCVRLWIKAIRRKTWVPSSTASLCRKHFKSSDYYDESKFTGWVMIPIKDIHDRPIRTYMIQIAVISNHQNGRDTHMRQIKVHSPCEPTSFGPNKFGSFSTVQFQQYATIR